MFKFSTYFSPRIALGLCLFLGVAFAEDQGVMLSYEGDSYRPVVCDEGEFIWFRVAKVCTRSIFQALNNQYEGKHAKGPLLLYKKKYKNYLKFAFVRNPFDRVVSAYWNKAFKGFYKKKGLPPGASFEEFVDFIDSQNLVTADAHIRLQSSLIPLKKIDFIGRFENFPEDLAYILERLGIDPIDIPHINQSDHLHYSEYYTPKTRKIIERKYRRDLYVFSYDFGD